MGLKRSSLGIMVIFAVTVIGLMGFPNAHADYDYLSQFGSFGTSNSQFDSPNGVAVDSSGNIYVADYTNDRVQKFASSGTFQGWIGNCSSGTNCDTGNHVTTSFCNDCTVLGSAGTGNGQFNHPDGIAFDSFGNIYVTDRSNARVEAFTSSGAFHGWIGNCLDSADSGNCDTGNHVTTNFCDDCTVLGSAGQISDTTSIAIDSSNNIYVTDTFNNRVLKFDSAGAYQSQFGSAGTGNGQFDLPHDVAIDSTGNIYVADTNNNRVQEFNSAGVYQSQFGTPGSGNGQFNGPVGIAFDSFGNIYVAEQGNNRVQEFNSVGAYKSQFGSAGTGNGQFSGPTYLAFDSIDDVYVADNGNNRVQNFGPLTTITTPADGETVTTAFPIISGNTYAGYDHVKVYENICPDGCVLLGSTTAVAGAWTFTPTSPLTNGVHTIFATGVLGGVEQDTSALVTFTVNVPVIPPIQAMFIGHGDHLSHGLAFVGSHLYSISSADNNIREINPTTGATISSIPITITGHTVTQGNGLAVNPIDQKLYAILQLQSVPNRELVTLNPTTGVATDIGNTGDKFAGLAFGADGTLYGVTGAGATVHDTIFTINTGNALTTSFVALPSSTAGESIAFNPDDGFLYNSQGYPTANFNKIDLGTKSITPISISGTPLNGEEPTALTFDSATGSFLWATLNNNLFNVDGNKILYGIAHLGPSGLNTLYTINPTTGAATTVGPITGFDQCGAMDFNAAEILFATCVRHSDSLPVLVTINTATGAATVVGSGTSLGSSISDISFRNIDRKLFAYSIGEGNDLYTIDTSTGVGAFVGSAGGGSGNGMAFSPSNVLYKVDSSLNTLDQSSGSPTTIASLTFPLGLTSPRINAMDIQPSTGIMFASLNDNPSNYLATVDTTTGVVTKIGSTVAGLDAIAFGPPASSLTITVDSASPSSSLPWGHDITVTGSVSNSAPGDTVTVHWGDASDSTGISISGGLWTSPTHQYATPGPYAVSADVIRSSSVVGSTTTDLPITVLKHITSLNTPTLSTPSVKWGKTYQVTANTLTDNDAVGGPVNLSGKTLTYKGSGTTGVPIGTTTATGIFALPISITAPGSGYVGAQKVNATFAEDPLYFGSSNDVAPSLASAPIMITQHLTQVILDAVASVNQHAHDSATGKLVDLDIAGNPEIPGKPITLTGDATPSVTNIITLSGSGVTGSTYNTQGFSFSGGVNIAQCPLCYPVNVNIMHLNDGGIILLPQGTRSVILSVQGSTATNFKIIGTQTDGKTVEQSCVVAPAHEILLCGDGAGKSGTSDAYLTQLQISTPSGDVGLSEIKTYDQNVEPPLKDITFGGLSTSDPLLINQGGFQFIFSASDVLASGLQVTATFAGDEDYMSSSDMKQYSTSLSTTHPGTASGFGGDEVTVTTDSGVGYTAISCGGVDADGDGICDSWETTGIPYTVGGVAKNYVLPGSPNVNKKDVYVEDDYMTGHQPLSAAITNVITAFANSGVPNTGSTPGVVLHVDTATADAIPHLGNIAVWTDSDTKIGNDYDSIKAKYFGTTSERTNLGCTGTCNGGSIQGSTGGTQNNAISLDSASGAGLVGTQAGTVTQSSNVWTVKVTGLSITTPGAYSGTLVISQPITFDTPTSYLIGTPTISGTGAGLGIIASQMIVTSPTSGTATAATPVPITINVPFTSTSAISPAALVGTISIPVTTSAATIGAASAYSPTGTVTLSGAQLNTIPLTIGSSTVYTATFNGISLAKTLAAGAQNGVITTSQQISFSPSGSFTVGTPSISGTGGGITIPTAGMSISVSPTSGSGTSATLTFSIPYGATTASALTARTIGTITVPFTITPGTSNVAISPVTTLPLITTNNAYTATVSGINISNTVAQDGTVTILQAMTFSSSGTYTIGTLTGGTSGAPLQIPSAGNSITVSPSSGTITAGVPVTFTIKVPFLTSSPPLTNVLIPPISYPITTTVTLPTIANGANSPFATNTLLAAKAQVYHYAEYIHSMGPCGPSGLAETPGNDLIVALGCDFTTTETTTDYTPAVANDQIVLEQTVTIPSGGTVTTGPTNPSITGYDSTKLTIPTPTSLPAAKVIPCPAGATCPANTARIAVTIPFSTSAAVTGATLGTVNVPLTFSASQTSAPVASNDFSPTLTIGSTTGTQGNSITGTAPGTSFTGVITGLSVSATHTASVGSVNEQAGTFMHELGHNLGLYHGGAKSAAPSDYSENCKPNYDSVMSYTRQLDSYLQSPNWILDYSHGTFGTLNENSLSEPNGVVGSDSLRIPKIVFGTPAYSPLVTFGTGLTSLTAGANAVNWNWNSVSTDTAQKIDINDLSIGGCHPLTPTYSTTLTDPNDWTSLSYDFRSANAGNFDACEECKKHQSANDQPAEQPGYEVKQERQAAGTFSGVEEPLDFDGTSIYLVGSTVELEFSLKDSHGVLITPTSPGTNVIKFSVTHPASPLTGTHLEFPSLEKPTVGTLFKYDKDDHTWGFQWGTKGLAKGEYLISVSLNGQAPLIDSHQKANNICATGCTVAVQLK